MPYTGDDCQFDSILLYLYNNITLLIWNILGCLVCCVSVSFPKSFGYFKLYPTLCHIHKFDQDYGYTHLIWAFDCIHYNNLVWRAGDTSEHLNVYITVWYGMQGILLLRCWGAHLEALYARKASGITLLFRLKLKVLISSEHTSKDLNVYICYGSGVCKYGLCIAQEGGPCTVQMC
jgi:hypothetical protein